MNQGFCLVVAKLQYLANIVLVVVFDALIALDLIGCDCRGLRQVYQRRIQQWQCLRGSHHHEACWYLDVDIRTGEGEVRNDGGEDVERREGRFVIVVV